MRDTFLLLWVAFLIIGVAGSIVSSIRKQIQGSAQGRSGRAVPSAAQPPQAIRRVLIAAQAPRPVQQAVAPKAPAPPKPPASPASPLPPLHTDFLPPRAPSRGVARLFRHRSAIVQAVIAAEVLGKPRAFNDEYFGA